MKHPKNIKKFLEIKCNSRNENFQQAGWNIKLRNFPSKKTRRWKIGEKNLRQLEIWSRSISNQKKRERERK